MRFTVYEPLREEPALFRKFADLDPADESRILAFANRYGRLEMEEPNYVDNLGSWKQEAGQMFVYVGYWDAYRDGRWDRPHKLNDVFRKQFIDTIFSHEATETREQMGMSTLPDRDRLTLAQAALLSIRSTINQNLAQWGTDTCVVYEQGPDRLGLRLVPRNLLAALWLQFARAVDGERDYRQCRSCRQWFQITYDNTGRRKTRVFCSNACRSKAYRARIEEAQALFDAGTSLVDISERLGSDVDTVRRWVKDGDKKTPLREG